MAKYKELDENTYRFVFSKAIRLCIDLLILSGAGVVLGKRSHEPYKDLYALPGGRMLFGETIDSAIKRIAKEEVGISVSNIRLSTATEYPDEIAECNRHSVSLVYSCTADKIPLLANTQTFKDISYSDIIKPEHIIPQHLKAIKNFIK